MKGLTNYKAVVKEVSTKRVLIITIPQRTLKKAFEDIQGNGYRVVGGKIKEEKEFDRIMKETNCEDWDWHPKKYKNYENRYKLAEV
jgi:phosphosulfolactate phosphohydrolase-like enzyme